MKLSCVRKKREAKFFHVKALSKYLRKTIVPSFMFLFNLSKSFVLCVIKFNYNPIFITEPMK